MYEKMVIITLIGDWVITVTTNIIIIITMAVMAIAIKNSYNVQQYIFL